MAQDAQSHSTPCAYDAEDQLADFQLFRDCYITLWTVFKISLGSVYDDMIKSVLCINFANGCQEDFIFCLILLSDLLAKQNQNSTHETMAESSSVIQNECHTPAA